MEDTEKKFEDPIFKHFFKTKQYGGFLSITPFNQGRKFQIEVGEVGTDEKLKQVTNAYVEFILLGAFLRAVVRNTASSAFFEPHSKTPATLVSYGGSNIDGKDTARILKITPMFSDPKVKAYLPELPFQWKCGHFAARKTGTGAYVPDMKSPVQQNFIKISRQTMEEISYIVDNHIMKSELGRV